VETAKVCKENEPSGIPDGNQIALEVSARLSKEKDLAAAQMAEQLVSRYLERSGGSAAMLIRIDPVQEPFTGLAEKYSWDKEVQTAVQQILAKNNWDAQPSFLGSWELTPGEKAKVTRIRGVAWGDWQCWLGVAGRQLPRQQSTGQVIAQAVFLHRKLRYSFAQISA